MIVVSVCVDMRFVLSKPYANEHSFFVTALTSILVKWINTIKVNCYIADDSTTTATTKTTTKTT